MIQFSEEQAVNEIMRRLHARGVERDADEIAEDVRIWHQSNRTTKHLQHAYEEVLRLLKKNRLNKFESIFPKLDEAE